MVVDCDPIASIPGDKNMDCRMIDPFSLKVGKGFDSFSCEVGSACMAEEDRGEGREGEIQYRNLDGILT